MIATDSGKSRSGCIDRSRLIVSGTSGTYDRARQLVSQFFSIGQNYPECWLNSRSFRLPVFHEKFRNRLPEHFKGRGIVLKDLEYPLCVQPGILVDKDVPKSGQSCHAAGKVIWNTAVFPEYLECLPVRMMPAVCELGRRQEKKFSPVCLTPARSHSRGP